MTIQSIITLAVDEGPANTTAEDIARLLDNSHHSTRILHAEDLQVDSMYYPRRVHSNFDTPQAGNAKHVDLPMTQHEARDRMDHNGCVEVLISVGQWDYHSALIAEATGMDYSLAELCHDFSFDFGLPYDPTVQIVGVENLAGNNMCNLLIAYRTDISTQLEDDED